MKKARFITWTNSGDETIKNKSGIQEGGAWLGLKISFWGRFDPDDAPLLSG